MYHDFFGFTQVPFSIAPDPDFLFLGPRHREGLAHLRNGLTGSGGFLLLTGEVGTGKTTLSRAILAELGDALDVAFVLNPMLSERELLATICDQFNIPGRHEKASLKRLTDHLSRFLQEAGEQGRNPVVLIDEAQHLLPSVLEQLRLLTNLETDSRKLLSVVLIGQPELQELLQRRELRQVAQRIVARYHLLPLTIAETNEYIQHRLQRVGTAEHIFNAGALKGIWQFSQGTPRLINLVCDRALQIAAREEQRQVTAKHVVEAASSLSFAPSVQNHQGSRGFKLPAAVATVMLAVTLAALGWAGSQYLSSKDSTNEINASAARGSELTAAANLDLGMPLLGALEALAERWNVASFATGSEPCQQLLDVDLACLRADFSIPELAQLDTPTIFESAERVGQFYLLLGYTNDTNPWQVWNGESLHQLSDNQFNALYSGRGLLLWQVPTNNELTEVIRNGLADRVPYSLQNRSVERQLQWLRQSQAARIQEIELETPAANELTAVELALLSSAHYQQRPRLSDSDIRVSEFSQAGQPRVTYLGAADTLEQLMVPRQSLTIPRQLLAEANERESEGFRRNDIEIADTQQSAIAEGERVPTQQVNVSESNGLDDVSPHIRALFDEAVADVGIDNVRPAPANAQALRQLHELTAAERRSLPRFQYNSHMFSGRTQERWIRINDRMLREGDRLGDLRVVQIEAAHTIFGFREILFRVEALEDLTD